MFDPDASASDPERTTDTCGAPSTFSLSRFVVFLAAFLTMLPGSPFLFIGLADIPYGVQLAAMVIYTAATILYTFSSSRGMQRYLFDCPYVRSQFRRLALRHLVFLAVLFLLLTVALQVRPHLPHWWLVHSGRPKTMPPFMTVLFILSGILLLAEIITNRSLLKRAHYARATHPLSLS